MGMTVLIANKKRMGRINISFRKKVEKLINQ